MTIDENQLALTRQMAYGIRKLSIKAIENAGWGHVGGSLSIAEVLAALYFCVMRVDPTRADWNLRDYLIFSKAHASPALYAALALRGFFPMERLSTYCRLGGLEGHLMREDAPGIEVSGGSLGMGLSVAAGIAQALKMRECFAQRVYCVVGDGELSEGQIWEGAMFAAQHGLDNLIVVVDYNKVCAKGFIYDTIALEPLRERFASFGFTVLEADGHDPGELLQAFHKARRIAVTGKPICIICHTVKGCGVSECEFNYRWHTHAPSADTTARFLEELALRYSEEAAALAGTHPDLLECFSTEKKEQI